MPGFELIGEEEKQAVMDVFDKGGVLYRYGLDEKRQHIFRVCEFENKIAIKVGAKFALCVNTGTAALKLGLIALGIKAGDEVITQSFTFIATVEAILELGAKPIIIDVDSSLNMDPEYLEKAITSETKAIIPVHMAGVSADMNRITAIAQKYKIPVLEDSAQALGVKYKGRYLGTIGDAGIYSLDIGKVITMGEGGVLVTNRKDIYQKALEYSDHGHECNPGLPRGRDTRTTWGFNYKVTELQGAVGLAQLKKLDYILEKQKENKKSLKKSLQDVKNIEFRRICDEGADAGDTLVFYVKDTKTALFFAEKLAKKGIGSKNLPDAINWHFAGTWNHIFGSYPEYKNQDLEELWKQSAGYLRRAIALPIMVNVTKEEADAISEAVKEIAEEIL